MAQTCVQDIMTKRPRFIRPDATLQEAAKLMQECECGVLPVCDARSDATPQASEVQGIITDRDMVLRAVAAGKDPTTTKVRDCMTGNTRCCAPEDLLEDAARIMHDAEVSRLLVKDAQNQVCGIITLGCIMRSNVDTKKVGEMVHHAASARKHAA